VPTSPANGPGLRRSSLWRAGAVVGGRYELRSPIGAGAMGEVWLADHLTLGTKVAVKLVDTANRDDAAELLGRFQLEARAAAQLKSPHVVQILDHGADGRVAFMAMELLEGESLERRIERRGRLMPSEVAHVLREMSRGVERAHAAGIVHRDLKPPNVFMARVDGVEIVKVLDFGIAKMLGEPRDAHLQTQAGFVVGTPAYMSPEQILGKPVDHRADLWQMAIIAFECMTGKRPFDGVTLGQLFMAVCTLPMPVPSDVAPVPPAFDAWFARAANRDPAWRYQTATEMVEALGAILAPGGVGESAIPTMSQSIERPPKITPGSTGRSEAWSTARVEPPRRASPVALIAGLVLAPVALLVGGGAYWLAARRPPVTPIAMTSTGAGHDGGDPHVGQVGGADSPQPAGRDGGAETPPDPPPQGSAAPAVNPAAKATAGKPRAARPPAIPRPGGGKTPVDLGI
jgi:serine/threonine protein kinase